MKIRIEKSSLDGKIDVIESKSMAHRYLVLAAGCRDQTQIEIDNLSRDIVTTMDALKDLGIHLSYEEGKIQVRGDKLKNARLNCWESGSSLRFILPFAFHQKNRVEFRGERALAQRPISDLVDQLRKKGVLFTNDSLPFIGEGSLEAGDYYFPGNVSSQYISGLLMSLGLVKGRSRIYVKKPVESIDYIYMTIKAMEDFGLGLEETEDDDYMIFSLAKQTYKSPGKIRVEADWSNAYFLIVAGLLAGKIQLSGLDLSSVQGDMKALYGLKIIGASIEQKEALIIEKTEDMDCLDLDMANMIDLVPILSILATQLKGTSVFRNIGRLRMKESDRIESILSMHQALGTKAYLRGEDLYVENSPIRGGRVDSQNDHRIAMSAAVAGLISQEGVVVEGAEAVEKSYPGFFKDLERLGAKVCYL